jgi:uncharacterized protein YycO
MPRPGDLRLIRGHGPLERLVEFATVCQFSHIAMAVDETTLIESKEFHGVRFVPVNTYPDAEWYTVSCSPETSATAVDFARTKLGLSYGWRDALDDGLREILHIPVGTRWQAFRRFDCSSLVVAAYAAAGLPITYRPVPSPADVIWSPLVQPLKENA